MLTKKKIICPIKWEFSFFDWLVWTGGFGSYLFGMSEEIAKQSSDTGHFKDPKLGWIIGFLFVVSFLGLFSVVPLRKVWHSHIQNIDCSVH